MTFNEFLNSDLSKYSIKNEKGTYFCFGKAIYCGETQWLVVYNYLHNQDIIITSFDDLKIYGLELEEN